MKKRVVLLLILFVMTFMLSGCCFWGGCGYCGTLLGSALFTLRPLMVTVTTRIRTMDTLPLVGTIAAGE